MSVKSHNTACVISVKSKEIEQAFILFAPKNANCKLKE